MMKEPIPTNYLTQVVPFGDNIRALFVGLNQFQPKSLVFLANHGNISNAKEFKEWLEIRVVPTSIYELKNEDLIVDMTKELADLKRIEGKNNLILNLGMGDVLSVSAAIWASLLTGIKVFTVDKEQVVLLPMLQISFPHKLSKKKLEILRLLGVSPLSIKELRDKTRMSSALLSFHINGNDETSGLEQLGLIKQEHKSVNRFIEITEMGIILLEGYCDPFSEFSRQQELASVDLPFNHMLELQSLL